MTRQWAYLRLALVSLSEGGAATLDETACRAYADLYAEHMRAEEEVAFPTAAHGAADEALAEMGAEMASRRHS